MTLIELLVTLIVLSFTITLISGALGQISQMLKVTATESYGFLDRLNKSRALQDLFANMQLDPTLEKSFSGVGNKMEFVSTALPNIPRGAPQPIQVKIEKVVDENEQFALVLKHGTGDHEKEMVLSRYDREISFIFIDSSHKEYYQWPPNGYLKSQILPNAVLIREKLGKQTVLKKVNFEGKLDKNPSSFEELFIGSR